MKMPENYPPDTFARAVRLVDEAVKHCGPSLQLGGYIPDQPDDPGRILLLLQACQMLRLTEQTRATTLEEFGDRIRLQRVGPPRRRRHRRPLIRLVGMPGTSFPAGAIAQSNDGSRRVIVSPRSLILAHVREVVGFDDRENAVHFHELNQGLTVSRFDNQKGVRRLTVRLDWGDSPEQHRDAAAGCLLWQLPAILGQRVIRAEIAFGPLVQGVHTAKTPGGAILIFLGRVAGKLPDRVEIETVLSPSETRQARNFTANVVVAWEQAPPTPEEVGNADARIGSLTYAVANVGIEELGGGWTARCGESVQTWRRRADAAFRHSGRAVTRSDFIGLVASAYPEMRVLEVGPSRLGLPGRRVDGVRVVIAPRRWTSTLELLDRAATVAPSIKRYLEARAMMGVTVDVGPPGLILDQPPPLLDPLSAYDEFLTYKPFGVMNRPAHPDWPKYELDQIPNDGAEVHD